ncbi:MAG: hypothetical protein WKF44_04365, partial [Rubrobacteraceae bacterium]
AAAAEKGRWAGALAGLVGGAVAAPVVVFGASAGALISARAVDTDRISGELSGMLGSDITSDETWRLILLAVAFAAVLQVVILVGAATAAGAWTTRK